MSCKQAAEQPMSRVLVIDDQNDVRAVICMVLQVNCFDVIEAASAAAGLKAFADGNFDAAIVDILLEDAMGYDVIAALRDRVPDLPIVAVSGLMSLDLDVQMAKLSHVAFLRKPFRPGELIRAIGAARRAIPNAAIRAQACSIASPSEMKNAPTMRGV
jgi:DNA-binding response OmpR family regulator